MTSSDLDLRLMRFRSRGDEPPHALASALIEAGRSHDALEVIHLGLLGNEDDAELVTLEGRALYEQGELNEAQSALVRAAKASPNSKEPYRWLAQVLIERGDPVRAVQVLERALAIDPADPSLQKALARAQRLAEREGVRRSRPSSAPPPATARPLSEGIRAGRAAPRAGSARAANQNAPTGLGVGRAARAHEPRAAELVREPRASQPPRAHGAAPALLFDEEVERDDESPTTAVEVPEEVRNWLRGEGARDSRPSGGGLGAGLGVEDDSDDEESEPTSIVPAAEELELLRYQAALAEAEPSDRTMVDAHPLDASALAKPGEAEPPEQVLAMLERQGVFEPRPAAPAAWATEREAQRPGARVTRALGLAWLFALLAAVGGYFGFDAWLAARRESAQARVAAAESALLDGQHESLLAAERELLEARSLDPKSAAGLDALLFVQTVRALDGPPEEFAPVRDTLGRAQQAGLTTAVVSAASALARPGPLDATAAEQVVGQIERAAGDDALASYLGARLAERAGLHARSAQLLERAAREEPRLALAALSAGEQARGQGRLDVARARFEQALGADRKQLRAELWLALLSTSPLDAKELSRKLDDLRERIARGSPAEQLVAAGVRAYAALAAGDANGARAVLRSAANLRTGAPEPLALYAEQALRVGESALAQRAVRAANELGGGAPRYQTLLAAALLQQGAGDAALSALGEAGASEATSTAARAQAALVTDAREALELAKKELAGYRATPEGKADDEAAALLMRVDMRLGGSAESLLPAARALVERAPDKPAAHLALADVLVRAEQPAEALSALEQAQRLAPGSPDVHYLTGEAQRLSGRPSEARASVERAIAIAPNHVQARRALGRMLLDSGEHDAALALFRGLESSGAAAARLGVIEALIGKGSLDEARARLTALDGAVASSPAAVLLRARLEQRRGDPARAAELLAPLVAEDAESRGPELLAAYGDALYAAGKVDVASRAYDAALELDAAQVDALLGRATVALHADRSDQALGLAQSAQAELARRAHTARSEARALVIAGRAQLGKGQLTSSRESLAKAVAMADAPAEAHFWLAETLARLREVSAVAHYTKYVQLEPAGPLATRAKRALAAR